MAEELKAEKTTNSLRLIKKRKLKEAPFCFVCQSGFRPTLELHHIIPVKYGGNDTYENTVLLCPNCHAKLHYILSHKCIEDFGEESTITYTIKSGTNNEGECQRMKELISVWISEILAQLDALKKEAQLVP